MTRRTATLLTALLLAVLVGAGHALEPDEVLVVDCPTPRSRALAEFYMAARSVPEVNRVTVPIAGREITHEAYRLRVRDVVRRHLADNGLEGKIRAAVTLIDVPMTVRATDGQRPSAAALDGELAFVLFDEADRRRWRLHPPYRRLRQPETGPEHKQPADTTRVKPQVDDKPDDAPAPKPPPNVLAVCRLDGPDLETAKGIVTGSLRAETDGLRGPACLDLRGLRLADTEHALADLWMDRTATLLAGAGHAVTVDRRPEPMPADRLAGAAAYVGWSAAPAKALSIEGRLADGAVAIDLTPGQSTDLHDATSRSAVWLAAGAAAVVHPAVAGPGLPAMPQQDLLWRFLLQGDCLAEAYWKAVPVTSWRTTLVGDPLYRPFARPPVTLTLEFAGAAGAPDDGRPADVLTWGTTGRVHLELSILAGSVRRIDRLSWWIESDDPRIERVDHAIAETLEVTPGSVTRLTTAPLTLKPDPDGDDTAVRLTVRAHDDSGRSWSVPLTVPVGVRPVADGPRTLRRPAAAPSGGKVAYITPAHVAVAEVLSAAPPVQRNVLAIEDGYEGLGLMFSRSGNRLALFRRRRDDDRTHLGPGVAALAGTPEHGLEAATSVAVVDLADGEVRRSPIVRGVRWLGVSDAGHVYYQGPRTLARYEPEAGRQLHLFAVDPATTVVPSPDASLFLCYRPEPPPGENPLVVRDARGRIVKQYRGFSAATAGRAPLMTWADSSGRFCISQASGRVDTIDLEGGPVEGFVREGQQARLSPQGTHLAWHVLRYDVWRQAAGAEAARRLDTGRTAEGRLTETFYPSPEGQWVAVRSGKGLVLRHRSLRGEDRKVVAAVGHDETVRAAAWSWDGRWFFFRVEGKRSLNYLYDARTEKLRLDVPVSPLHSATFSADNRKLYLATDGAVLVYDVEAGAFVDESIRLVDKAVVAVSPGLDYLVRMTPGDRGGSTLALGTPALQWFVDLAEGPAVVRAQFDRTGRRLLTEDAGGTVTLWRLPSVEDWSKALADRPARLVQGKTLARGARSAWMEADGSLGWVVPRLELHLAGIEEGRTDAVVTAQSMDYRWLPDGRTLGVRGVSDGRPAAWLWTAGRAPKRLATGALSMRHLGEAAFVPGGMALPAARGGPTRLWVVRPSR